MVRRKHKAKNYSVATPIKRFPFKRLNEWATKYCKNGFYHVKTEIGVTIRFESLDDAFRFRFDFSDLID